MEKIRQEVLFGKSEFSSGLKEIFSFTSVSVLFYKILSYK